MKVQYMRLVPRVSLPIGNFRSHPAEIGVTDPIIPIATVNHYTHPQAMSTTTGEVVQPQEASNCSTLAIEFPPQP